MKILIITYDCTKNKIKSENYTSVTTLRPVYIYISYFSVINLFLCVLFSSSFLSVRKSRNRRTKQRARTVIHTWSTEIDLRIYIWSFIVCVTCRKYYRIGKKFNRKSRVVIAGAIIWLMAARLGNGRKNKPNSSGQNIRTYTYINNFSSRVRVPRLEEHK